MKYLTLIVVAALVLTSSSDAAAPFHSNIIKGSKPVPNSYIVKLKNDSSIHTFRPKFDSMVNRIESHERNSTKINQQFSSFPGIVATLDSSALKKVLDMPEVDYVDQNIHFTNVVAVKEQDNPPSWGLPRVSRRKRLGTDTPPYQYPKSAGKGVTVYVIDTGIRIEHPDFEGRATNGANFIGGGEPDYDVRGHGTHVAGTVGGKKYGVAKKVNLVGVKVVDKFGSSTTALVTAGIDWVVKNAKGKSIISISLQVGPAQSLNDAVQAAHDANIPVIVAATNFGNGNTACDFSPAGANYAFTVAAMQRDDHVWSDSTLGKCVDIFAPGVDIISATFHFDSTTLSTVYDSGSKTGTSMATPHVSGVAALFMGKNDDLKTALQVYKKLRKTAHKHVIRGELNNAPNLLVYNGK